LSNGETLTTDILTMAIGVHLETKLAPEAGLNGIYTSGHIQTSYPSIYAVVDAIEE